MLSKLGVSNYVGLLKDLTTEITKNTKKTSKKICGLRVLCGKRFLATLSLLAFRSSFSRSDSKLSNARVKPVMH
jgi:hypothetical protein